MEEGDAFQGRMCYFCDKGDRNISHVFLSWLHGMSVNMIDNRINVKV
jgi:hypothetical protein